MGCSCNMNPSTSPPVFSNPTTKTKTKTKTKTPTPFFSSSPIKPKQRPIHFITLSSIYNHDQQQSISTTSPQTLYTVNFKTLKGCKLGIARYPDFVYDAEGGLGTGTGTGSKTDKQISVSFDLQTLYIPSLSSATTKFLGLPLPPLLKIDIVPELFRGTIDEESGKVNLEFKAKFWFSVGSMYKAPALVVETILTSEESSGRMRRGRGDRLDSEGKCRLVGVATVDPIDDLFMNTFLGLPTECLAQLNATINLSTPP